MLVEGIIVQLNRAVAPMVSSNGIIAGLEKPVL
jgi:hypothetical protein